MSLPPDVGTLVTNQEVVDFVKPMNNTISSLETVVIQSVEDMVEDYCQRRFLSQEYEDEPYLLRRPSVTFDGWTTSARTEIRLRNRPITEFTALKHVSSRDATTGEPSGVSTLGRNLYRVDLRSGIVIFNSPILSGPLGSYGGYPQQFWVGVEQVIDLLATYTAGFAEVPPRLKLAVLMIISRVYTMTTGQNWHRTQTQTVGGAAPIWQEFIREECGLTPEEKLILSKFKTPIAA